MCGRYSLISPGATVAQVFGLGETPDLAPHYNLAPGQEIAAVGIRRSGAPRTLRPLRWGLVPSWAKDPAVGFRTINARAETLTDKPSFRDSFRRHRCLLPADGFYEWAPPGGVRSVAPGGTPDGPADPQAAASGRRRVRKQAWLVRPAADPLWGFGAVWAAWRDGPAGPWLHTCAVITVPANDRLQPIHDRMPLIVPPEDWELWLDPTVADPAVLEHLLRPLPSDATVPTAVGEAVNRVENDGPECWASASA